MENNIHNDNDIPIINKYDLISLKNFILSHGEYKNIAIQFDENLTFMYD
jgi:hypothetical protein